MEKNWGDTPSATLTKAILHNSHFGLLRNLPVKSLNSCNMYDFDL